MEVHKFSKFIHGCAVLLPEEVTYFINLKKILCFFLYLFFLVFILKEKLYQMIIILCYHVLYCTVLYCTVLYKKIHEKIYHDKISRSVLYRTGSMMSVLHRVSNNQVRIQIQIHTLFLSSTLYFCILISPRLSYPPSCLSLYLSSSLTSAHSSFRCC